MSDDDRESLARRGLKAAALLEPGAIPREAKARVAEAAGDAALRGLAAVGRLTGGSAPRSEARQRAAAEVDVGSALADWTADDLASFEARVREAARRPPAPREPSRETAGLKTPTREAPGLRTPAREAPAARERSDLAALRRSFPPEAQELALLIFNCVDLLEELSSDAEGAPPSPPELARKEELLTRIAALLAPRAGEALTHFVEHVVATSRRCRAAAPQG